MLTRHACSAGSAARAPVGASARSRAADASAPPSGLSTGTSVPGVSPGPALRGLMARSPQRPSALQPPAAPAAPAQPAAALGAGLNSPAGPAPEQAPESSSEGGAGVVGDLVLAAGFTAARMGPPGRAVVAEPKKSGAGVPGDPGAESPRETG